MRNADAVELTNKRQSKRVEIPSVRTSQSRYIKNGSQSVHLSSLLFLWKMSDSEVFIMKSSSAIMRLTYMRLLHRK